MQGRVEETVRPFCKDLVLFLKEMRKRNGFLTGAASFDILYGVQYPLDELHIFVPASQGRRFIEHLSEHQGYFIAEDAVPFDDDLDVKFRQRLTNGNGFSIVLVESRTAHPLAPSSKNRSTCSSMFVSQDFFVVPYASLFTAKKAVMFRSREGNSREHAVRYMTRGIQWIPLEEAVEFHDFKRCRLMGDAHSHVGPMADSVHAGQQLRCLRPWVKWHIVKGECDCWEVDTSD